MVRLHQFRRGLGLPNPSPFCMKVETWLRLAGVDYELVKVTDPRRLPMGKAPVVEHDGRIVADSALIVEYLGKALGIDLDAGLTATERHAGHAFTRMLEERTCWAIVYSRWLDPRGWAVAREAFFGSLPAPVRAAVGAVMRRRVRRALHGQGLGRHSADTIYAFAARDLEAVAGWLGDKPYFMGANPTGVDAAVYAFVASAALDRIDTPLGTAARSHANLVAYCERMHARCFADLAAETSNDTETRPT